MKRIHVCGGGIRALLIADVARRVEQVAGRQCFVSWSFDEPAAPEWNIYPPDEMTSEHPPSALLVNCEHAADSITVANFSGTVTSGDPLAARLALLARPLGQPAVADDDARETLRRWRASVAHWARSPGAALSRPNIASAMAAFSELDTARGVEVLRTVEADSQIPPGSKFETFAYLDRVVGLDLARDLGGSQMKGL